MGDCSRDGQLLDTVFAFLPLVQKVKILFTFLSVSENRYKVIYIFQESGVT